MPGLLRLKNGLIKRKNKIIGNPIYHPVITRYHLKLQLMELFLTYDYFLHYYMKFGFKPYEKAPDLISFWLCVEKPSFRLVSIFKQFGIAWFQSISRNRSRECQSWWAWSLIFFLSKELKLRVRLWIAFCFSTTQYVGKALLSLLLILEFLHNPVHFWYNQQMAWY